MIIVLIIAEARRERKSSRTTVESIL